MLILYIFPLILSVLLGLMLAYYVSRYMPAPGALPLTVLILAVVIWSGGYALEIAVPNIENKLIWAQLEYLGIVAIAPTWAIFCARYLDSPSWLARSVRNQLLLGVIPAVTFALAMTSRFHGLIWQQVELRTFGDVSILEYRHGVWFSFFLVYTYGLLSLSTIWMASRLIRSARLQRTQIGMAVLASLVPLIGNLVYISPLNPVPGLDWTPFSFIVAGLLFALSLFRYKLLKIAIIARQAMFERLEDLILVLDGQERVIDMNPAAERLLAFPGWRSSSLTLSEVFPELAAEVAAQADSQKTRHAEITLGQAPERRDYEVRITPLSDPLTPRVGRLLALHDVTLRKQEKELLRKARDELELRVAERTEDLKRANEQITAELAQRTAVEQALRESETTYRALFENANDAILLMNPDGIIWQVNQKAADMLGYTRAELVAAQPSVYMAPEDYPDRRRKLEAALAGVAVPIFERHYRRKDGTTVPTEVNIAVVRDLEGSPKFIQVIARDISERRAAEREQIRLLDEISQSREQLRALAARLQEVQEFERRQIASELHDRVGQNLTGLSLNLQIVQNLLPSDGPAQIQSRLEDSLLLVEETTRQVRDVLSDLVPPLLDEFGLASALRWYGREFSNRTGINIQLAGQDEPRLGRVTEMALFRIAQEALNNITRHAGATQVNIVVQSSGDTACLKVEDNGQGFDPALLNTPGEIPHLGLITMKERAVSVGGQLTVQSAPGKGTLIIVEIKGVRNDD